MASSDNGYNPLLWDCKKDGCFNKQCRPKIEVFCDCFPGKINFGDLDGIVEINGKALILEWKGFTENIPTGQKIMYQRITLTKIVTVIVIIGNPVTMECEKYCLFFKGKQFIWVNADLLEIKERIKDWGKWARG